MTNDTNTIEQPLPKIGRRKYRAQVVAAEFVKGIKTYEEIGAIVYPNAANPRQTVYSALQKPGTRAEIQKLMPDYDAGKIRRIIGKVLDSVEDNPEKITSPQAKVLEIGAKTEKMIGTTDETKTTQSVAIQVNFNNMEPGELNRRLVEMLRGMNSGGKLVASDGEGVETK